MATTAVAKLGVLCLAGLLVLQGCAGREPAPSKTATPVAGADGFTVRLDSFSMSEGPPRSAKLQLTIWNKSEQQITVDAKDITVVDSEGQSAVSAGKLYVVDQERREASVGEVVAQSVLCVVVFIICAPIMIVNSIALPIREAGRHRPAVVVRAGGDETVSVSLTENPVRFDILSVVRVRRQDSEQVVELPITDALQPR